MISRITLNEQGRWQTDNGTYFTSGDRITIRYHDYCEVLILEGRIEHGEHGYYFTDNEVTIGLNEQIEVILD